MKKVDVKTFLSTLTTIFIITLIVMLGPANAVTISVSTPGQTPQFNEITVFTARIDLQTTERIPFQNISATIKDESNAIVAICYFDINGNKLSPCDASFVTIQRLTDSTIFDEGNRTGTGFGDNGTTSSSILTTDFGYGYGYGHIGSNTVNELQYQISWRTPNLQIAAQTYTVEVEANAQSSNALFTYKLQTPVSINVAMNKPVARLANTTYNAAIGSILELDASLSSDPNSFSLTNYYITKNGNIITSSNNPQIHLPINLTGFNNYNLTVQNSLGINSTSLEFTVNGISEFDPSNFVLNVDRLVERGDITFEITPLLNFNNAKVKVMPFIECIGIRFDYKPKYLDTKLILNEANKTFNLKISRQNFDVTVPLDNDCTFKTTLVNINTNEQITLSDTVNLVDDIRKISGNNEIDAAIDNGNDLINYIYSSFGRTFSSGYNSINFNFKNDRQTDIKAEIKIIIPQLDMESYEDINIGANSQSKVSLPIFITKDTKKGVYPMRISYRIDGGELKTKYGFINID